jgi:PD-(D/E)XK endonuclease
MGTRALRNTTTVGDLTELEVATALTRAGMRVLRPLSNGLRHDLAIDNGDGSLMRIQCKTGILRAGWIEFRAYSADARRPRGTPYWGQIEAFAVFCPQTQRTYLVPISAVATPCTARLRLEPARNGQEKRTRRAADFEVRAQKST